LSIGSHPNSKPFTEKSLDASLPMSYDITYEVGVDRNDNTIRIGSKKTPL
jgi:hypothetical protein